VSQVYTTQSDPTESLFVYLKSLAFANGPMYKFAISSIGVQNKFVSSLFERVRWTTPGGAVKTGFETAENSDDEMTGPYIAGVGPLLADDDCPSGTAANTAHLLLVDPSSVQIAIDAPPTWIDNDGSVLHQISQYAEFEATYVQYRVAFTSQRNVLVRATQVNELTV